MRIIRVLDSIEFSKMSLNQLYQKDATKYLKESRYRLTFMSLAEKLFVILIFFLVPCKNDLEDDEVVREIMRR